MNKHINPKQKLQHNSVLFGYPFMEIPLELLPSLESLTYKSLLRLVFLCLYQGCCLFFIRANVSLSCIWPDNALIGTSFITPTVTAAIKESTSSQLNSQPHGFTTQTWLRFTTSGLRRVLLLTLSFLYTVWHWALTGAKLWRLLLRLITGSKRRWFDSCCRHFPGEFCQQCLILWNLIVKHRH